ncbi:MAG TPA: NAD-dependent epimerase/dehydratase family protein [Steroidobacteraceae bacterium]|jgi:UDP-glucose 4-epimerase|nr:NAD-dependent epimerase/dehydratase family protein [Steroidobacteraceae bacterium]
MKVLVTGGCGFIGSAVVNHLLAKNHDVHIVDNMSRGRNHWVNVRHGPSLYCQDILDLAGTQGIFESVRPEAVIHLAAHHYIPYCEQHPFEAYELNVSATLNIVEICRRWGVGNFFFASTGDVYPPTFAPHREVDMVAPIYVYGHTKYLAEQICIRYFSTHRAGDAAVIGRIFNAAGPRETNPHLIPEVVRQIAEGKEVIEVGNLWPKRDFVDVDGIAEAIVELTLGAQGVEIVNIGSGYVQEIGSVLELLGRNSGAAVTFMSVPERQRPNDRPYLCPDVTRLKRLIGHAARAFDGDTVRRIFAEQKTARSLVG